jgi:hypothetical protein
MSTLISDLSKHKQDMKEEDIVVNEIINEQQIQEQDNINLSPTPQYVNNNHQVNQYEHQTFLNSQQMLQQQLLQQQMLQQQLLQQQLHNKKDTYGFPFSQIMFILEKYIKEKSLFSIILILFVIFHYLDIGKIIKIEQNFIILRYPILLIILKGFILSSIIINFHTIV